MSGWRTVLVVQGHGLCGESVPMATGLVETAAGDVQTALRLGEQDETVILPLQSASRFEAHVHETIAERLKVTAERLEGGEP